MMCMPTGPEADPMACADGRDNDCDGQADCADLDCRLGGFCGCVPAPEVCNEGRDNDCDMLVDCADTTCRGTPACPMCVPTGTEADPMSCADGRDNDCDGQTDCADMFCVPQPVCSAPPPNDTCARPTVVSVPSSTMGNLDGARNDFTPVTVGFPGCQGGAGADVVYVFRVTRAATITIDTLGSTFDTVLYVRREPCQTGTQVACNDDASGVSSRVSFAATPGVYYAFVDGFSAQSRGNFVLNIAEGATREICNNLVDDDGDRIVDCADPDCAMDPACRCIPTPETTDMACSDGRDNDCDGVADCADSDCRPNTTGGGECCNGRDDNANGLIDEFSCACESSPQCAGVGSGGPFPSNACWSTTFRVCAPRCDLLGGNVFCNNFFPGTRCNPMTGECSR